MWSRYFQCSRLHAWDINTKQPPFLIESKATFHRVDQLKIETMDAAAETTGHDPFDLIVDDGLHSTVSMWNTFASLWPWVKPGGFFVAEDLHGCLHSKDWDRNNWGWCDQPDGAPSMFMMLHYFNESHSKGVAAAEKAARDYQGLFPRVEIWRAFADEVSSIVFKARDDLNHEWPEGGRCHLKPYGDETSKYCRDVTAIITKKPTAAFHPPELPGSSQR